MRVKDLKELLKTASDELPIYVVDSRTGVSDMVKGGYVTRMTPSDYAGGSICDEEVGATILELYIG